MDVKGLVALAGVLLATAAADLNDAATALALADIRGGFGIGHDAGTWINSLYASGQVVGMAISPWFMVTISHRRWCVFVFVLSALSGALIPFSPDIESLYTLRILQGLAGGLTVPLLMDTALRVLTPDIRLYGLAVYALTATFTPSLADTTVAFWESTVRDWRFVFLQSIPLCSLGALLVWYGLPQDPPRYSRFRLFDWRGLLLLALGGGALTTLLIQGDRLDWFGSPFICVLALVSAVAMPLFLVNEWLHPLPFIKLQMLGRRNFAYGVVGLFLFIIASMSGTTVPLAFLERAQGFRPVQANAVTLLVAATQVLMLPTLALLLNVRRVDGRIVSFIGMTLVLASCFGSSYLTVDWLPDQFYLWQALQAVGQPMIVMPLLLMATNTVTKEEDAPFASSLINCPRAFAEAVGTWLLDLVARWRGALHSDRLVSHAGAVRWSLVEGAGVLPKHPPPLLASGRAVAPAALDVFNRAIERQVTVMTTADTYLVLGGVTMVLMAVLILLPVRTLPPRLQLARS